MSKKRELSQPAESGLFDRVATILDQARSNVARSVNSNMVLAYCLIGREIVQELQGGDERAEYGKQVIENLSARLNEKYGKGYSATNLKYFRLFYQAFSDRWNGIRHPAGDELTTNASRYPAGSGLPEAEKLSPTGRELAPGHTTVPLAADKQGGNA